jgi:hypothetical protein
MSSDNFCPVPSFEQGQWRRAQERAQADAQARAVAARQAELRTLLPRAERGDVPAMQRTAALLADARGFRIEVRSVAELSALGIGAYFVWPKGPIVAPPISDMPTFATVLHEWGHGVAGPCPRRKRTLVGLTFSAAGISTLTYQPAGPRDHVESAVQGDRTTSGGLSARRSGQRPDNAIREELKGRLSDVTPVFVEPDTLSALSPDMFAPDRTGNPPSLEGVVRCPVARGRGKRR